MESKEELVIHSGGCHCKRVRWKFELEEGSEQWLTLYTFETHQAKHLFCKVCGICSFYTPRSNTDGRAVTVRCVDPGTIEILEIRTFDGQNWEESYTKTNIAAMTKE
ncbi:hypothetical protein R1sor_003096 [Riccia sorocarpa]|uniref:CENP-V/GFA domain-containing protein n=1 Tax=Riccia sorocarpa TaxID=122646 RepID=A0ABD3H4I3_9MARC